MKSHKVSLVLSFALSMTLFSFAQETKDHSENVKIEIGDPYKSFNAIDKFFLQLDDDYIIIKYRGLCKEEFSFQKFQGSNFSEIYHVNQEFELPEVVENIFQPKSIKKLGSKVYLFYTIKDFRSKTDKLYAKEINTKEGGFYSGSKLLDKVSNNSKSYHSNFGVNIADNKLILFKNENQGKRSIYNENLEEIQNDDLVFPLTSLNHPIINANFYSSGKKENNSGVNYSYTNQETGVSKTIQYQFPENFINKYTNNSDNNHGIENLHVKNISYFEDGGALITGEISFVNTSINTATISTSYSSTSVSSTYFYWDIILVKINSDGEVQWIKKIPKHSTRDTFMTLNSEKYLYTIFRDNPKNQFLDEGESAESANAKYMVAYRTNLNDGSHEYLELFNITEIEGISLYRYNLNSYFTLSDTSFAFEMYIRKKRDMMIIVEFEE